MSVRDRSADIPVTFLPAASVGAGVSSDAAADQNVRAPVGLKKMLEVDLWKR